MKTRNVVLAHVLALALCSVAHPEEKVTPGQLVAKHLESIGPAEARAAVKNVTAVGSSKAIFRSRSVSRIDGRAVVSSEEDKILIGMAFDALQYPHEKMGFDGKDMTVAYASPGVRSPLANFVQTYAEIFKQGLVGGTLSTVWCLLKGEDGDFKLEHNGRKKIGDSTVEVFRFTPKKGSDLKITLFFDSETYRHVRSEYRRVVSGQMGLDPARSAEGRESRYTLVEEFSDFKKEGGLTLPHSYKLSLSIDRSGGTQVSDWIMSFDRFLFNQPINPQSFNVAR